GELPENASELLARRILPQGSQCVDAVALLEKSANLRDTKRILLSGDRRVDTIRGAVLETRPPDPRRRLLRTLHQSHNIVRVRRQVGQQLQQSILIETCRTAQQDSPHRVQEIGLRIVFDLQQKKQPIDLVR